MQRMLPLFLVYVAACSALHIPVNDAVAMRCADASNASCTRLVFTVLLPRDFTAPTPTLVSAVLARSVSLATTLQFSANGVPLTAGTADAHIPLRAGLNTVEVAAPAGVITALKVPAALSPLGIGATTDYVELEAEEAAFTGTLIGPSYTFTTLPSEASARKAVQLSAAGQYVEFTLPVATNAVAVRFSIPNSPTGTGWDAPLLLTVDGNSVATLTLTSAYSWYYGSYPFTKNPADGLPHHFYDTVRALLPETYPVGAKLRLVKPSPAAPGFPSSSNYSCGVNGEGQRDCGFSGINWTQCVARNCCYVPILPNPNNQPWCYYPPPPPSPSPPPPPNENNLTLTIDLVDLYLVGPPIEQPPGALSVLEYGADPSGLKDSTGAFASTVAAAKAAGAFVWVPQGNFTVTAHVILDNVTVLGAGQWYSMIHGDGVGLYGNMPPQGSSNVQIHDVSIVGEVKIRDDSSQVNGIGGALSNSVVANVHITHTKCGMWLDGPFDSLLIAGATVHDGTADGINFHDGVTNSVVEQSVLRNTGDDGLAMWAEHNADTSNTFRYNTVQVPVLANCIAIYGGSDNAVFGNDVRDSVTEGGGLHVGNRFNAVPLAGHTTLANNSVTRCGCLDPNWQFGVGALWFYALDSPMTGSIAVANMTIDSSPYEAIHFIGSSVTDVAFDTVAVTNVTTFVFQFQCGGSGSARNVVASGVGFYGIYDCGVQFNLADEGGNAGWNSTHCGFPPRARSQGGGGASAANRLQAY